MFKKLILGALAIGLTVASCDDDDNPIVANAGIISGGPFTFRVDDVADNVSGITLNSTNALGENSTWVVTDEKGEILGLPPTLEALEGVNFDDAGPGVCLIWYARYNGEVTGLAVGEDANSVTGDFALSNAITVSRIEITANAGTISGGPFTFLAGDGMPDMVSGITLDTAGVLGDNSTWIITDAEGKILGLPPTLEAVEGVDFDGAGVGTCLIWYARYFGEVTGLEEDLNANDIFGDFDLSNSIEVVRNAPAKAGVIAGGPFEFDVDEQADMVSGIMLDDSEASGENSTWIITDDKGVILGLPMTLEMVEGVNFDEPGAGTCLIWYARYNGEVTGLEKDLNANDIVGDFDLSNSIEVVRNQVVNAGTITGGPFEFVKDVAQDFVTGIVLNDKNAFGENSTWIVTAENGDILELHPTLAGVEAIDFNAAAPGVCLIWYARYNGTVTGLAVGENADSVTGDFDLSNSISVTRVLP